MHKVAITTFGCKLNQAESAQIVELLTNQGYEIVAFEDNADCYIFNSCTVTANADSRCRQAIRRAKRLSPKALIIITGCYAEVSPGELEKITGVDYILGSDYKFKIIEYLNDFTKKQKPIIQTCGYTGHGLFQSIGTGTFLENTRAFLKIQDGCNAFCSYCIVPYARGEIRSGNPSEILIQAKKLIQRGFREIVLTGAHIGLYGRDLSLKNGLFELLSELNQIDGHFRIRLSSLEPNEVTDELLELMASTSKICPHLHIPLQSGDDEILRAMNRKYSLQEFSTIIRKILKYLPDVGLGMDVIVGFPGETEAHFNHTLNFIESLPISYLHVFAYSVRKGTLAATLPNRVSKEIQMERSRILRKTGQAKKMQFHRQNENKIYSVLFEQQESADFISGLTPHYIRVRVKADASVLNEIHPVKLVKADQNFVLGEMITTKCFE
ncbi:tRNA (N(6)-L-threonylcarbamoyladenosine(37)-C(2))-methylthiotransferase MtaB [candidate division KSB1 bacterium]|nr:tRNA (N(6)-L-threonylcarbamoyladenosine(37)-C(2))-methylthiotransferase MtaB [candidate division KSB1 bacterium]